MRSHRVPVCAASCLVAAALVLVSSGATAAADRFDRVRDYIREQLAARCVPSMAIAVVDRRKIVWEEAFGWADRERRVAATTDTPYSLASLSKPLTATGLMVLVEQKKLDLDRPINDYLGRAKLIARVGDERNATVRTVANHSSGLPLHYQFFYSDENWPRPSMDESILRYGELMTVPGRRFEYSNFGYGVLDHLIARSAGVSFDEFMRRQVFLPLGMTRTSVGISPALEPYAAVRYGSDCAPIPYYTTDHTGASEIYSSVHDLARFALFHLKSPLPDQKPPLPDGAIDEMHRGTISITEQRRYGVGFFDERKDGYRFLWHTGGMGGVATDLHLFPDQGIAIVAVANAHDRLPLEVVDRIAALLLPSWRVQGPEPLRKAVPFKPSPALVGSWHGKLSTYVADQPAELIVRADGEMHLKFGNQLTALVNNVRIEDGILHGELHAKIGTPDTERFPYVIELSLTAASGRLSGAATAIDEESSRVRNALSSWLELTKADE